MENLDLTQILRNCPKGTKLYSLSTGEVTLEKVWSNIHDYPIWVESTDRYGNKNLVEFTAEGWLCNQGCKCMLFPSKDNRDWSTFKVEQPCKCMRFPSRKNRDWSTFKIEQPKSKPKPQKFEPKQWVLVRNEHSHDLWRLGIFSHYDDKCTYRYACTSGNWSYCIPYEGNEALLGTSDDPKEFYGGAVLCPSHKPSRGMCLASKMGCNPP